MEYIWIPLIALLASFVQTTTGLGFAIIAMCVLPLIMPFSAASVLTILSLLPMVLFLVIKNIKHLRIKIIILPTICAVITSFLGVMVSKYINDGVLRFILGIILILVSVYFTFFSEKITITPNILTEVIFGSVSGFLGGVCNMSGPPIAIYIISSTDKKEEYAANLQFFFLICFTATLISHIVYGNFTWEIGKYALVSYLGVIVGTTIGLLVLNIIPMKILKKIVFIVIGLMGILMLILG